MVRQTEREKQMKLERRQLLRQLRAAPAVTVRGVVAALGAGGGMSQGEKLWTLRFALEVWRVGAGKIETQKLTILKVVSEKELRRYMTLVKPNMVVCMRARVVADSLAGTPHALLESFRGSDVSDRELNDHASELQKPVTFRDSVFGKFTLDRRFESFDAKVRWKDVRVQLDIDAAESRIVPGSLKTAHILWKSQERWNRRIEECAVHDLLPLKNGGWRDENEPDLTADQFKKRMKLFAVSAHADGSFSFSYDDRHMFFGHLIIVRGSLSEGPTSASIEG